MPQAGRAMPRAARRCGARAPLAASRRRHRLATVFAGTVLAAAALPASASAHGLAGRTDLPVPSWLFAWAASLVLVLSFVGLAVLWQKPRLEDAQEHEILRIAPWVDVLLGAFAVGVFAVIVYAGLAGNQTATANIAPTFIYVTFWVGLVPFSAVLGNVFEWLSPWRAFARAASWLAARTRLSHTTRPYPERLGRWPAALGIVAFAWVELVLVNRDDPHLLALLTLAYVAVAFAGMYRYGIRVWCSHADPFGVYFGLFAAMSPLVRRDDRVYRRPVLSGLAHLDVGPGSVGLLCAIIGSTTFDGLTNGQVWTLLAPKLENLFSAAGVTGSAELAGSVGLLFSIGLAATIYRVGVNGMSQLGATRMPGLSLRFVHSLVPIAFAYAMAHYFSYLLTQGQALGFLASDPLGSGANLFGTARWTIDYKVLSSQDVWYLQTLLLVSGHAAGLALAHDRALVAFRDRRTATRSQYWMLAVMVGYTSLGLWLLSTINV